MSNFVIYYCTDVYGVKCCYKLLWAQLLYAYIREEYHVPDIPDAGEMAATTAATTAAMAAAVA